MPAVTKYFPQSAHHSTALFKLRQLAERSAGRFLEFLAVLCHPMPVGDLLCPPGILSDISG